MAADEERHQRQATLALALCVRAAVGEVMRACLGLSPGGVASSLGYSVLSTSNLGTFKRGC